MAFGLSPKYKQDVALDDLKPEQFLVIAIAAVKELEWNLGTTSETGFIAYTKISMSSWSEEIKVKIEGDHASLKSECTGSQLVDWGRNKRNVEDFIDTFNKLKASLSIEDLAQKYEELKPGLISDDQDALSQSPLTGKDKLNSFFAIFIPTPGYFVTPILINLNIAIFILMVLSGVHFLEPDGESLLKWGANFRPTTLDGEGWRLLTCCFLHIGIFHLLMNMYALLYIGVLLEPHLGSLRFTAAYLLTGITASITSLMWHDFTVSAGASGAIFGLYGVFLAMLTTNLIEKEARKTLLTSIAVFVGYNLLNGLKGGIDNAAHIGGLIGGLVIGYAFLPTLKNPADQKLKFGSVGILSLLTIGLTIVAYKNIPNDIGIYNARINDFAVMEEKAMLVYRLPQNAPKVEMLAAVKDTGIYYWNENIKLTDSLKTLNLPVELMLKLNFLKEYCMLRRKSFEVLYRAIYEESDQYKAELDGYNQQIDAKIKELGGGQ